MSTAVGAAPTLTAAQLQFESVQATINAQNQGWTPRYAWYAGPEFLGHKDLPDRVVSPCQWLAIPPKEQWKNLRAFNESHAPQKIRPIGRGELPREGMDYLRPAVIATSLLDTFSERGLLISSVLAQVSFNDFLSLNLDGYFFPDGAPATYAETKARLDSVETDLSARMGTPQSAAAQRLLPICAEMQQSLEATRAYHQFKVDEKHNEMERARTDTSGKWKGTYDKTDLKRIVWLGIARKDEALNKLAAENSQLPEIVRQMVEANAQAPALLGAAIAEGLRASQPAPQAPQDVATIVAAVVKALREADAPAITAPLIPTEAPKPVVVTPEGKQRIDALKAKAEPKAETKIGIDKS